MRLLASLLQYRDPGRQSFVLSKMRLKLAHLVGERFLRVDGLCIEQDSQSHTVSRLFNANRVWRCTFDVHRTFRLGRESSDYWGDYRLKTPSTAIEVIESHKVAARRPVLAVTMAGSGYPTWVWNFQARLWSKRYLISMDQQVYHGYHTQLLCESPTISKRGASSEVSYMLLNVLDHARKNPSGPDLSRPDQQYHSSPADMPLYVG